jgi:hypothetical protein
LLLVLFWFFYFCEVWHWDIHGHSIELLDCM